MAVLVDAYREETLDDGQTRVFLQIKPALSPIKAAVIPLAKNKPELVALATELQSRLKQLGLGRIKLEDTGNIGKA